MSRIRQAGRYSSQLWSVVATSSSLPSCRVLTDVESSRCHHCARFKTNLYSQQVRYAASQSITSNTDLQKSRTLRDLLENCSQAVDAGDLSKRGAARLFRDKNNLVVNSWRSVCGLRQTDLLSTHPVVLEVFLDCMLNEEFSGKIKACRVLAHDQLAVLQALQERPECEHLVKRHKLIPILVYNTVRLLESLDFAESLGNELHNVCLMLLMYLCHFKEKKALRQSAIRTVFGKTALQANPSLPDLIKMLHLLHALDSIVDPWIAKHLLARAEQCIAEAVQTDSQIQLRESLAGLCRVSVSFGQLAARGLTEDIAKGLSTGSCCTLLEVSISFESESMVWRSIVLNASDLSLAASLSLLERALSTFERGSVSPSEFRERVSALLERISELCEQPDLDCSCEDILARSQCLLQLRSHPVVRKLGQRLQSQFELSTGTLSASNHAKLAYLFSVLDLDLSPKLFPAETLISMPSDLVNADLAMERQAALIRANSPDSSDVSGGVSGEATGSGSDWSSEWATL
eukprot:scpid57512/ scgid16721/ 